MSVLVLVWALVVFGAAVNTRNTCPNTTTPPRPAVTRRVCTVMHPWQCNFGEEPSIDVGVGVGCSICSCRCLTPFGSFLNTCSFRLQGGHSSSYTLSPKPRVGRKQCAQSDALPSGLRKYSEKIEMLKCNANILSSPSAPLLLRPVIENCLAANCGFFY